MARTEAVTEAGGTGSARAIPAAASRGRRAEWARGLVETLLRPQNAQPVAVFALSRFLFVLLTYFGVILFNSTLHGPHPSFLHQLLSHWNPRWDNQWYTEIAQRGYAWQNPAGTSPTAFFPLYPLLLRLCAMLLHRSYLVAGLTLSNACFLGALLYLWRLAAWEAEEGVARRAILYVATFPTALFFFAGYSESLFLLLTVACFFHLRRREWLLAGSFAALASATRVTGVLLTLPLLYEYARDRNFDPRFLLDRGLLGVLIAPAGLLAFMAYLQWQVGDPLSFAHQQAAWQKIFTLRLWAGFSETARQIIVEPAASFYQAHNFIDGGIGGLVLVGSVLAARRLPLSYGLYLAAFWLVTLSSPAMAGGYPVPLVSLSRYVLSLVPVFIYMGMLGRRGWFHTTYLVLSPALLAVLTVQFINNRWVI